jgi:hypothetical protein
MLRRPKRSEGDAESARDGVALATLRSPPARIKEFNQTFSSGGSPGNPSPAWLKAFVDYFFSGK